MIVQINIERREAECFDIRKLTPRECYRLMAVRDESIDRLLASPLAQSAHYKLAGNSIVQDVLTAIFRQIWLCGQEPPTEGPLELFPDEPWPERLLPEGRPLEVVTLCSGYDSQCLALDALAATPEGRGLRYRLAAWAEFDPDSRRPLAEQPAVVAHRALFSPDEPRPASACVSVGPNLGDMTKIDWGEFVESETEKRNSYGREETNGDDGEGDRMDETRSAGERMGVEVSSEGCVQLHNDVLRGRVYEQEHGNGEHDPSCSAEIRPDHQVLTYEVDLLTYSTPCFVAGTLVMTADGLKPIEDIGEGDRVLTHTNQYRPVVTPMQRQYDGDVVTVKPMFCDEIRCTDNHPFYVRTRYRHGHKWQRAFREPEWKEAARLTKDDYLGYAVNTESRLPDWQGTVLNFGGRHTFNPQRLRPVLDKEDFWYLMGRYLGDGWVRDDKTHKAMIICSSAKQEADWLPIQRALENLGWRYTLNRERTTLRFTVYGKELTAFCQRYGHGAAAKHIDADTMALPVHLLRYFIMGYKDSDGHYSQRDRSYHFTSVSYRLLLGLGQCIAKVYHRPFSITHCHMPHVTEIEGRRVNQRDFYVMRFKETTDPQDKAFYEDGYLWMPINHIDRRREQVAVYNMEVSADHSYTANGAIVHNCQSISQAGKREGIAEGSGTRSAVLWYTLEALRRLRPRFALQENVAALVNQQNMPHFRRWQQQVSELGYDNYWAVLNASDYGVPQNRDRVFMLSVRKDLGLPPFRFPRPVRLERSIADVLEPDVDPRYFLRPESVVSFLTKNEPKQREQTGACSQSAESRGSSAKANEEQGSRFLYMTTDHVPTAEEIREYVKELGV